MAPEQVRGNMDVDGRADVYAVGVIAFAALTGRFPFERTNALVLIARKLERAPPTLESVSGRPFSALLELFVSTAMAADRDRRYPRVEVARAAWREATR
jgi:serine/threonine-protein kinase